MYNIMSIIMTQPAPFIISTESPYIPSITFIQEQPYMAVYENLDANPEVHADMARYFYYKTLDKWLYDDLIDILNYFVVTGGKVELIKNMNDYKSDIVNKDTQENIEAKISFIEKYLFSKDNMMKILKKFVRETSTHWYQLTKNEYYVRQVVKHYLKNKIKKAITVKK